MQPVIHNICDCVTSSTTRLFANDTVEYRRITSCDDADALQHDTDTRQGWTDTWLMQFNPSKCQILRITLKRKPVKASYTISGQTLKKADLAKLPGMDTDSKLTFNNHVDSICKQANSTVLFSRNLRSCTKDTRYITYTTYIRLLSSMLPLSVSGTHTSAGTPTSLNRSNTTLPGMSQATMIMVTLCNRADHYIFAL